MALPSYQKRGELKEKQKNGMKIRNKVNGSAHLIEHLIVRRLNLIN